MAEKTTKLPVLLEIYHDRGVIYAHLTQERDVKRFGVATILRIGTTPAPIPDMGMLDIVRDPMTGEVKFSWRAYEETARSDLDD